MPARLILKRPSAEYATNNRQLIDGAKRIGCADATLVAENGEGRSGPKKKAGRRNQWVTTKAGEMLSIARVFATNGPYEIGYFARKHKLSLVQAHELIKTHGNNRAILDAAAEEFKK
jgi:hypothetical protein